MAKPGIGFSQKRIHKEINTMTISPPPGTRLCLDSLQANDDFIVEVVGAQGTLFCGERFKLLFKFGERYPFESPQNSEVMHLSDMSYMKTEEAMEMFQSNTCTWKLILEKSRSQIKLNELPHLSRLYAVMFIGDSIPVHPHVYSNGHICLSILTDDWSPALSVEAICLSILSMLSSCTEKKRPPDNALYVRTCSSNPKDTKWWFHDDKV